MINVGVSEGFHDAGVTVLEGKKILHASHSERYSRVKNDKWISLKQLPYTYDNIAYYESPFWKNTRRIFAGQGIEYPRRKYNYYFRHHQTHAAAGYLTAPFHDCNIIVIDAIGEWETITISHGKGTNLNKLYSINFPNSLGMLYSTITAYLGFKPNQEEGKIMELSQKGNSNKYYNKLNKIFIDDLKIHQKYFTWEYSEKIMFNINLCNLLNLPPRLPEEFIKQDHKDLAAALQKIYEEKFLYLLNLSQKLTNENNICLGGGCAYNYLANKKIKNIFKNSFIPPNPSDSGSPIGACLYNYYKLSYEKNNIKN